MTMPLNQTGSWILKGICAHRGKIREMQIEKDGKQMDTGKTSSVYHVLIGHMPKVSWKNIFLHNEARPRAAFVTWMACNNRLATKTRLARFGMVNDVKCCFCNKDED